jgi:hypothetical protein
VDWCVEAVTARGGATRIAQAIGEGDIGWWARDGQQVDWALCCLARNLVAEKAVMDFLEHFEDADHDATCLEIMTPRAWNGAGLVFDYLAPALARVMGFNVLVVSLASKSSSSYTTPCLGDTQGSTEFQIRVLSYNNHYFLWRQPATLGEEFV